MIHRTDRFRTASPRGLAAACVLVLGALADPMTALDRSALVGLPTIVVDGAVCTLADAIRAANDGTTVGGCTGTAGIDALQLDADVVLTAADTVDSSLLGGAHAALPDVTSAVVLAAGAGTTIERDETLGCDGEDPDSFRLLNVAASGALYLFDLTLRHGCVAPASGTDGEGGAIFVDGGTLELSGVTLESNTVLGTDGGDEGALGGALLCREGEVPAISGSTFRGNRAQGVDGQASGAKAEGGAAYFDQCPIGVIEDSLFEANEARGSSDDPEEAEGGALVFQSSSDVGLIRGVTFDGNLARGGDDSKGGTAELALGGAFHASGSTVSSIHSSVFRDNRAEGGIGTANSGGQAEGGAIHANSEITSIRATVFEGNSALGGDGGAGSPGSARGGAIDAGLSGPSEIADTVFRGNRAISGEGPSGGPTASGGALRILGSFGVVERTTFVENEALSGAGSSAIAQGGAIQILSFGGSVGPVSHSTFVGNRAVGGTDNDPSDVGGEGLGGAILLSSADGVIVFTSNTFVDNEAQGGTGAMGSGPGRGGAILMDDSSTDLQLDNNLFSGNATRTDDGTATPEDCAIDSGTVTSVGYNRVAAPGDCTFAATGDQTGAATAVYELADRGCETPLADGTCVPTLAIDQTSPAADQGSCTTAGTAEDARETPRPFDLLAVADADDACDIGAFEAVDADGDGFTEAADCAPTDPSAAEIDACGECGGDGSSCLLFADGFESGDTTQWVTDP